MANGSRRAKCLVAALLIAGLFAVPANAQADTGDFENCFGPVQLNQPGGESGELAVVAHNKAAQKLQRTGRVTVNPRIRFAPAGEVAEIGVRHEFQLRRD